jgi:hypothetical protein
MISQETDHCSQELTLGVFWLHAFIFCMNILLETDSVSNIHLKEGIFSSKDCCIEVPATTGSSKQLF